MGIVACVEPTTTTVGTTTFEETTATSTTPETTTEIETTSVSPTSGTTTIPTSVTATTACQKDMAFVGGQYVSSVDFSVEPEQETDTSLLTSVSGDGIDFPTSPEFDGVLDENHEPQYQVTLRFNQPGVDSLGSITVNALSNVDQIAVRFYAASQPNMLVRTGNDEANEVLTVVSNIEQQPPSVNNLPSNLPSPIIGIRVLVLSTKDNQ